MVRLATLAEKAERPVPSGHGTFTMRHELDCDCETFWRLFFEKDFNEQLFKALEFPEWKLLDTRRPTRRSSAPSRRRPRWRRRRRRQAARLELRLRRGRHLRQGDEDAQVRLKPNVMTEKLRNEGTVKCEPRAMARAPASSRSSPRPRSSSRRMIESSFEKSFRTGWQKSADFINKWVKDTREGPALAALLALAVLAPLGCDNALVGNVTRCRRPSHCPSRSRARRSPRGRSLIESKTPSTWRARRTPGSLRTTAPR